MKPGSFIIEKIPEGTQINSEDYGMYIQDRPDFILPKRKVEFDTSFGQSGSSPFDEEAYENIETELAIISAYENLRTSMTLKDAARIAGNRMFNSGTYRKMIMSHDEKYEYFVMRTDTIKIINKRYMGNIFAFTFPVTFKPYKQLISPKINKTGGAGTQYIDSPILYNDDTVSLPLIKITGNGNCTITVNGKAFVMKNVTGHIYIDSDLEMAYRLNGTTIINENSKINTIEYPYLSDVRTSIVIPSGFTAEIEPRWRSLI